MSKIKIFAWACLGITLFSTPVFSQKAGDWTVGLGFQPFLYWKYNKSDWNFRPTAYPESPRKFNGWASGISASKYVTNSWGLGTELTFSRQKQTYNTLVSTFTEMNDSLTYYYAKGAFTRLDYLKLPVYAFFNQEIGYESGLFLKIVVGAQVSFNTNYYGEYRQYHFEPSAKTVTDSITNTMIVSPSRFFQDFVDPTDGSHLIVNEHTKYLYQRFELGALAGIALQKRIFGLYIVSLGIRYELAITDIESPKEDKYYVTLFGVTGLDGHSGSPRPATHNRRLMLDIGISRIIE